MLDLWTSSAAYIELYYTVSSVEGLLIHAASLVGVDDELFDLHKGSLRDPSLYDFSSEIRTER
jgi:hypothetical protein